MVSVSVYLTSVSEYQMLLSCHTCYFENLISVSEIQMQIANAPSVPPFQETMSSSSHLQNAQLTLN